MSGLLEKIHRWQLIISDHRRLRDGDGLGSSWLRSGWRDSRDFNFRLGFFFAGFFQLQFYPVLQFFLQPIFVRQFLRQEYLQSLRR